MDDTTYVGSTEVYLADLTTTPFHLNSLTWIGGDITLENCFSSAGHISTENMFL